MTGIGLAVVTGEIPTESDALQSLAVALLDPSPDNPRQDAGDVDELAQSIRENGGRLLQPIVVVPAALYRAGAEQMPDAGDEGRYVVIAGHRRRVACLQLGLEYVDCIVRTDLVGPAAQIAMLVENLQRVDLAALEEANAFERLKDLGLKQRDIADRVGRSQAHISKRLSLLKLPAVAQAAVVAGDVSLTDAAAVATLAENPDQFDRAWKLLERNWYDGKRAVAEVLGEDERLEKVAAERTRLSNDGLVVVDERPDSWNITARTKVARLDGFTPKPRNHKKQPCHAFYVDYNATVVEVCTDPKQHITKDTAADDARTRERAVARACTEAQSARHVVCRTLITGGIQAGARAQLLEHLAISAATSWAGVRSDQVAPIVRRLLETDVDDVKGQRPYAVSALQTELEQWPDAAAALAVAIAYVECFLEPNRTVWAGAGWYFDLLVDHGHELADVEHEKLGHVRTSAGGWTTPEPADQ